MAEEIEIGIRQKLREDFISGEPNALTDAAILELLLSYALSRGNPGPLARKLIQEFGGLDNVLSSDFDALCRVKGVKSYTATLLKLAEHLRSNGTAKDTQSRTVRKLQQSLTDNQPLSHQKQISFPQKDRAFHRASAAKKKSDLFTNSVILFCAAVVAGYVPAYQVSREDIQTAMRA